MAISTDSNGNTFAGNFASPDPWEPNDLLAVIRSGLGNNDRANINRTNVNNFRIDWRPNESTTNETLTGIIATPATDQISSTTANDFTLTTNSRFALCHDSDNAGGLKGNYLLASGSSNVRTLGFNQPITPTVFTATSFFWAVTRRNSISYFVQEGGAYYFFSQGILENSIFSFPDNRYSIYIKEPGDANQDSIISDSQNAFGLVSLNTFGANANYPHNNGSPTTNEVELYLRRTSDNQQIGYIPNVFKFTIDGSANAPAIGEIVNLNFSGTTGFYSSYGANRKGIVVGRLGNASVSDLTGHYLMMLIAGGN